MAVLLARGKKTRLGAMALGCLDICVKNIVRLAGRYNAVSYAYPNFLQPFQWGRFKALSPMPKEYKLVQSQIIDEVEKVKMSLPKCVKMV